MAGDRKDHTLEFLLDFHGRVHHYQRGYWVKFEIWRVNASRERPHGLSYSFTLHGPDKRRLIGFDNAHPARPTRSGRKGARVRGPTITGTALRVIPGGRMPSRTLPG